MTTSSKKLGDWFDDFEREAFRLETLDDYSKSGGVDAYHAFLAGEPQPEGYATADWMTTVGKAVHPRAVGPDAWAVGDSKRPDAEPLRFTTAELDAAGIDPARFDLSV